MTSGVRETKRRATRARIAETGLRMFLARGYDETTLEAIAVAAGVSPRTFFHYFQTKEEVLTELQGSGFFTMLQPTLLAIGKEREPLAAVRECLLKLVARYETPQSIVVDRVLNSTPALRQRKQLIFADMEALVWAALCQIWPPARHASLHVVAMVAVGALRLGMDAWRSDEGRRPLADYVRRSFERLRDL